MAETATFHSALGRVGYHQQEISHISEKTNSLCVYNRGENPVEVYICLEQMLDMMRYWAHQHVRENLPVNPALFTLDIANKEAKNMVIHIEEAKEKDHDMKMRDILN